MPQFEFDVFLSFASLNESIARTLYNQLRRSGLKVFWSDETLKRRVGKSWQKEIEKSLEASKHMVLLWTDEATQSHWVEDEYRAFYGEIRGKKDRLLVPVLGRGKDSDSLPLFLRQLQTYPLNGTSETLITSLGGRYIPLEQENERLRQELEEARKKVESLTSQNGQRQEAELNRVRTERDEWKRKYADLENKALDQSKTLTSAVEERETQIDVLEKRMGTLEKELTELAEDRKALLVDIAEKESEITGYKEQVATLKAEGKKTAKPRKSASPSVKGPAKTFTDNHGIEFILIEPGSFMMGDKQIAKPVHKVEITRPFYLGKYAVTQAEWKALSGDNPSSFDGQRNPVENVSWNDVQTFLKKINSDESRYHLPSEAQWEYACRAGTTTAYSFGDDVNQLEQYAWYDKNANETTHPVGEKKPNPWGLYDMHGNVWEWVNDWWGQYEKETVKDPVGPGKGTSPRHPRR